MQQMILCFPHRLVYPRCSVSGKLRTTPERSPIAQSRRIQKRICAFTGLIDVRRPGQVQDGDGSLEDRLVKAARRFISYMKCSHSNSRAQRALGKFQALILLSLCYYLRQKGISYEIVDGLVQEITESGEYERRRLLDGAAWANNCVIGLVRKGYSVFRATELFFLSILASCLLAVQRVIARLERSYAGEITRRLMLLPKSEQLYSRHEISRSRTER